ncbi:TPA: hypothetical protein ACNP37_003963 [Raoultella ornithinolytica]
MIDYDPARREIKAAKQKIEQMKLSKDYDSYERLWRELLINIQTAHNKLKAATLPVRDKFTNHFSKEFSLLSTDPLLSYLVHARNQHEHQIYDVAQKIPPSIVRRSLPGRSSHYIEKMVIKNGKIVEYKGDPLMVSVTPETCEVVAVSDRGRIYQPPEMHLGKPLKTRNPIEIGTRGVNFYKDWIERSSKVFV